MSATNYLPMISNPATPALQRLENGKTPMTGTSDEHSPAHVTRQPTVLLADDNEFIRYSVGRLLRARGFRVIEAVDGANALELATDGGHVDVVITDYQMPRLNGVELLDRLRVVRPGVPVILISGDAEALRRLRPTITVLRKATELGMLPEMIRKLL